MRKIIFFCSFIFGINSWSQAYELDTNFGTNGILRLPESLLATKFYDGKYYMITGPASFYLNQNPGTLRIVNSDQTITDGESVNATHIEVINGNIYTFGVRNPNSDGDMIVKKFSLNGISQSNFGVNGVKTIDFGQNEEIMIGMTMAPDGNLLCAATRRNNSANTTKIITFKLDPVNGNVIDSYDVAGFKEHLTLSTSGSYPNRNCAMVAYGMNLLLVGCTGANINTSCIDTNGNVVDSYGVNGTRIYNAANSIYTMNSAAITENKLYVQYDSPNGTNVWLKKLKISDVSSGNTIWEGLNNYDIYSGYGCTLVTNDGIYSSEEADVSFPVTTLEYKIRKQNLDGTRSSDFHANGIFRYAYHGVVNSGSDRNEVVNIFKNDDGTITAIGYAKVIDVWDNSPSHLHTYFTGYIMFRLRDTGGPLTAQDFGSDMVSLAPNPFEDQILLTSASAIERIELYDLRGRKLSTPRIEFSGLHALVDLSAVTTSGTYFLKIYSDGKSTTQKIVRK